MRNGNAINNAQSENVARNEKKTSTTLSGRVALILLILYAAFGCFFYIPLSFAYYLLLYFGIPIAILSWLTAVFFRVVVHKKRNCLVWTATKYGINSFGVVGLVFLIMTFAAGGCVVRAHGFWFHMKLNADVHAIRAWSAEYRPSSDANPGLEARILVHRDVWPECIRRLDPTRVAFSRATQQVTLVYGGGFGHWGLCVAREGTKSFGDYVIRLQDGAWVWHEIQ